MRNAALLAALVLTGCDSKPVSSGDQYVVITDRPEPALTAPASTPPVPEQNFQALGTEPFWAVEVTSGRLSYSTPENHKGTAFPARRTIEGEAQVWTGTFEGSQFTLRIAPGTCSDGMSDAVYAYTAQVAFAGKTLLGCARQN